MLEIIIIKVSISSSGFSIMGNFVETLPNQNAMLAAKQVLLEFERRGAVKRDCWSFYGHRDKGSTTCPGDALYNEFQTWNNWHKECDNTL